MAPKIFSSLTIIIAGFAIWLGFESEKRVIELQEVGKNTFNILEVHKAQLKQTRNEYDKVEALLTKTEEELRITREELAKTKEELASTKAQLAAVTAERDAQKAALEEMTKKISEALGGIAAPENEGDPIKAIERIKEQIANLTSKVKDQETKIIELEKIKAENETVIAGLTADKARNEAEIAAKKKVIGKYEKHIMDKGIKGRVLAVNPGWGFCVVSTGDKQGAANGKVLIVARDGKAIGKVKITSVEANQSIADIQASTFIRGMFVQPGDEVIYTGDEKVKFEEEKPVAAVTAPAAQLPLPQ